MKHDNIFFEDVEIPEVVQKKADSAFLAIKTERNSRVEHMAKKEKKLVIRAIAAAACAALVISSGILGHSQKGQPDSAGKGAEDAIFTAVDKLDKMFTMQVKAAESEDGEFVTLAEGTPVPVSVCDKNQNSWVICSGETGSDVNYCIAIPQITCEGVSIENVTYRINNGAFQIVQPENEESIIVDGELYEDEMNTGSIGGDYHEERDGEPSRPFETLLYKSFTLDYDRQYDEYTWMNICNVREDSEEIMQLLWEGTGSEEEQCRGIQKMLDDTVITCTVNYADHTSRSANIKVDACVMTRKEAGEPLDEGIDPEEEMTAVTFELQQ